MQQGDMDTAVHYMQRYLQAVPSDALAWATLGRVLLVTGDVAGADKAMNSARASRDALDTAAMQSLDREVAAYAAERRVVTGQDAP
jgi:cytochrome c-type biogenesis protein CcmH/NrfG